MKSSKNPLLEFCLDGGRLKQKSSCCSRSRLKEILPRILEVCASSPFTQASVEELRRVLMAMEERKRLRRMETLNMRRVWSQGDYDAEEDVNVKSGAKGMTAMHFLVQGERMILGNIIQFFIL